MTPSVSVLGCEPPHCRGEHGQDDNWHPNEPRRASIFPAHYTIEEREAGQSIGCRETSYERLLLYPPLRCEPWADRNTKNNPPAQRTHPALLEGSAKPASSIQAARDHRHAVEDEVVPAATRWLAVRRSKFSASSRLRDLNRSATNIPSSYGIANIALNDEMILPYDANPGRTTSSAASTTFQGASRRFIPHLGRGIRRRMTPVARCIHRN
jgi:hypothetical protein